MYFPTCYTYLILTFELFAVRIIRAMGASADAIFYGPQQEVENESKHLAQIILQCTPKERMLIAAIVDTILDVRQRECGLGETEEP